MIVKLNTDVPVKRPHILLYAHLFINEVKSIKYNKHLLNSVLGCFILILTTCQSLTVFI